SLAGVPAPNTNAVPTWHGRPRPWCTYSCTSAQPKQQSREREDLDRPSLARLLVQSSADVRGYTHAWAWTPMPRVPETPYTDYLAVSTFGNSGVPSPHFCPAGNG